MVSKMVSAYRDGTLTSESAFAMIGAIAELQFLNEDVERDIGKENK